MGWMAVAFMFQDIAVAIDHLMNRGDVTALVVLKDDHNAVFTGVP
jgi:hypothetical protein